MSERGQNIRDRMDAKYEKSAGYLLYDVTEAVGQEMAEQDAYAQETRNMFYVDNLTGDYLTTFVDERRGVKRREATCAVGKIRVTGNGAVKTGDLFETAEGVQFEASETKGISTEDTVKIKAVIAGNSGVVGAGSITQMPVTMAGIATCVNEEATYDGYDEEDDDSLRKRYYAALQVPANGANKASYEKWALEVEGVGGAKVYPLGHGENTVDVVIVNQDMEPADATLISTVQEVIDPSSSGEGSGKAMIGAHCFVSSATGVKINITGILSYTGTKEDVVEKIKTSVKSYFKKIALTGKEVSHSQVTNAIVETEGVDDVESLKLNGGSANIPIEDKSVAILGTVVFTDEG